MYDKFRTNRTNDVRLRVIQDCSCHFPSQGDADRRRIFSLIHESTHPPVGTICVRGSNALHFTTHVYGDRGSKTNRKTEVVHRDDVSFVLCRTWAKRSLAVDLITDLQENQRKATLSLLANAKEICAKHGIIAEMATEVGEPKEVICEAAEKLDVRLLILGSHGRGAIQRAFLGSVSDYCVHDAKCPVVVVKRPA